MPKVICACPSNLLGCGSDLLIYLPKKIKRTHSKLTLTTYENIEVRRIASAAQDMLKGPVDFCSNWVIDGTKNSRLFYISRRFR